MSEQGVLRHGSNPPWETASWAFSNSDNSPGGSDQKFTKKVPPGSRSGSPVETTPAAPKRSLNGMPKNGKADELNTENKGSTESDHEMHIWTERERRKKMRNMFSSLHALLPQLPAKADKSTIVDEAVNYIKTLQHSLQKLQKQRLEMIQGATMDFEPAMVIPQTAPYESRESYLADKGSSKNWAMVNSAPAVSIPRLPHCFQTWSSPNVILSVTGDDAHISVCASRKPGLLVTIFYILEKHRLQVITAHISSDYFRCMYMIHARANGVSDHLLEAASVEEIFKLAVGEIILWLSS
ncbi:transcription factor bHLH95-like [Aristolochia californica]|uniref:transcription factor bHLH95-like n=1 Tax=Aristolochia californica TaxID=171875 RepID=UPI0035DD2DFA